MSQETKHITKHSGWMPYVPVVGLAIPLAVAIAMNLKLYWAMATGSVVAAGSAWVYTPGASSPESGAAGGEASSGPALSRIYGYALKGVSRIANVVILVLLVNAMTAVWFSSGTIQSMVYYGLSVMHPGQVLVAGLIISTLVSMMLGSSVGTAATVGVAVLGIAKALGMPLAPVAGAIMSGAVFGDRVSFLSPIFHLAVDFTGSDRGKATKRILATGVAAWLVALVAYLVMGYSLGSGAAGEGFAVRDMYLDLLSQSAKIGLWALVPPALVMLMAAGKVPVRLCLIAGLLSGALVAVFYQGQGILSVLSSAISGYHTEEAVGELSRLLRSGGIAGTRDMVLLLGFAGVYTGITELSGMMEEAINPLVRGLKSRVGFLMTAMGVSVFSAAFASNQAMSVILPARLLEGKRKETGTSPEDFAGALADSGMAAAAVIPWNVMAALCAQILQMSPLTYAPYSFFLSALPVAGAVYAVYTEEKPFSGRLARTRSTYRSDEVTGDRS